MSGTKNATDADKREIISKIIINKTHTEINSSGICPLILIVPVVFQLYTTREIVEEQCITWMGNLDCHKQKKVCVNVTVIMVHM